MNDSSSNTEKPILFVRNPQLDQMRDPLPASWNKELTPKETSADSEINLAQLIDFSQLNDVFASYLEVIGLPVSIIDFNGHVLASSNWQRICIEFHRANQGTLIRCLESDTNLSRQMQEGKDYAIYRCRNGLTDCASPIVIEGQHIANLFIGQFFLKHPDHKEFEAQCAEFGFDHDAYFQALAEVPIVEEQKIPHILKMLVGFANQIAKQSLAEHRARVAYESVEKQVIERTRQLIEKELKYRQLFENMNNCVAVYTAVDDGEDFIFVDFNHAAELLEQKSRQEVIGKRLTECFPGIKELGLLTALQRVWKTGEPEHFPISSYRNNRISGWRDNRFYRLLSGEVVAIYEDITAQKQAEEEIYNLAYFDPLTQLPNRRLLNDRLSQAMAASKRSGCYGAVMFLDLDNFKPLNDKHGHGVGDLLLIEVAKRLKECVREMDTVARFGGDEFVVMLNELDVDKAESYAQARIVAEKILTTLSEPYLLAIKNDERADTIIEHHCTASIGITLFIHHDENQVDVIKLADVAMYQAKDAGRNLICFYDQKA
ncbi:PocR ligand-binding domain-containing protein [Methylobacter sp.]|uniref:PocR ligand-binding domain-containing protein n=1 Tax=Methylobacter sp. TaxID=2051955 RepID=UPI001226F04C|nr:PocR ligand-binding domain-containing protein [Methylobacter sp.]TAK59999.1 MAG: diguanylate cyclase [Methylobacter sp.]